MAERYTRRDFFRIAAGAGASFILNSQVSSEHTEVLHPSGSTVLLDFAPQQYSLEANRYTQPMYADNDYELKRLLGNDYVPFPLLLWKNRDVLTDRTRLEERMIRELPRFTIAKAAIDLFSDHGLRVAKAMHALEPFDSKTPKPILYPLQSMLQKIDLVYDEKENPGIQTNVDIEKITRMFQRFPEQEIGNISWVLGNTDIYFVTNGLTTAQTKVYGARGFIDIDQMTPEEKSLLLPVRYTLPPNIRVISGNIPARINETANNIQTLAQALPQREFNIAGGNYGEDFLTVRNTSGRNWPDNVRICAEWMPLENGKGKPAQNMQGADIYVDNEQLKQPPGSSFSTGIVTRASEMLRQRGIRSLEERDEIIRKQFCDVTEYETVRNGKRETLEATVFKPNKFSQYLASGPRPQAAIFP